jgi:hypothetical protein
MQRHPLIPVLPSSLTSALAVCAALLFAITAMSGRTRAAEPAPTFNRDVAPIVFENCVVCHHPGGTGPFSLAEYREVKKRAKTVARVTASHFMPPWLPERGVVELIGERGLTDGQIATIDRWSKAGAPEGAAADLKVKAQWKDGWQLGPPDLVVTMPEPYTLPADGPDIYRNFVIPNVVSADRYVTAFEMRPGNPRAVHHAFLKLDRTGFARQLAEKESDPGFPGMSAADNAPGPPGTFGSWQPGRMPERQPEGMPWILPENADIVLKMHMRPTGKPEQIQGSVGFYFTDRPPARLPFVFCLRSTLIDIPAGAKNFPVETSYTLPVDGTVLAVLPHLHYLGREVHGWAELPDGATRELILIRHWDFNWQSDYRYLKPIALPKGATVHMRYTYDNSAANPRSQNHPPQRVRYGPQSADEMAEFWLQFLPQRDADMALLRRDYLEKHFFVDEITHRQATVNEDPHDAANRAALAATLYGSGRVDDAAREARQALRDDAGNARAHSILGHIAGSRNQVAEARSEFAAVVALEPGNSDAQNNLGFSLLVEGKVEEAISHLEKALVLNPGDTLARQNLEKARAQLKK